MLIAIGLQRRTRDGNYAEILDVADYLGEIELGNATNALAQMARDSGRFKDAVASQGYRDWLAKRDAKKNGREQAIGVRQ
jgi:hypothetical protein